MTWQPELDELRRREEMARRMGGADKVKRQHDGGRLTVRERIDGVLDQGSFHEVGAIAGKAQYDAEGNLLELVPSNCVFGRGKIDGRPVVVVGDDFTVRGGSADATIKAKPIMAEKMAAEFRLPIIRIIEGSGGGGSVKTIETTGRANLPGGVGGGEGFFLATDNLSQVPVVGLGLGSVAGLGAARLAATHYSIMTKNTSAMFVAGPPVVNALGHNVTKQELGGWEIQTKAGGVDDAVDTEAEAFERVRRFLSYLPSSVHGVPPVEPCDDPADRRDEALMKAIPRDRRKVYKMRSIIESVVDQGSFFEMGRNFGRSVITGLCRLGGHPVAVMASDPYHYAGAWTADACQKVVRFVDLAETFHLPVVYLMDCPGFLIGVEAERSDPARRAGDGGDEPDDGAVVHDRGAQFLWCRRRGAYAGGAAGAALCVAFGLVGLAAAGRRDRGGVPGRYRRGRGPEGEAARDRGPAEQAAIAVPHRGDVPGGGDHRPARHAPAAVRVRPAGRAAAHAGAAARDDDAAVASAPAARDCARMAECAGWRCRFRESP
jgi:acetyl-CoA carboxylase carboxyltransferase component